MKKIINSTDNLITEMLDGIVMAFPKDFKRVEGFDKALITPRAPVKNKVGIATGGGSGHLPLFLGYIGENLLDGAAVGDVFSSPSAETMLAVTKAIDSGKGVLYLYGNYGGDIMNFDMAAEMAEEEGIRVETSIGCDDVASAPADDTGSRRGIAGLIFAYKIAGAKAATGASLEEVKETTDRALSVIRTMGVALSPCTIPAVGLPTFEIGDDEMEIGMGIHGERGIKREKLKSAHEIASFMTERVIDDLPFESGDEVAVLINGLGATAPQELYVTFRKVKEILDLKKINIYKSFVGEYATSMEMKGLSITLFKLDKEFKELLYAGSFADASAAILRDGGQMKEAISAAKISEILYGACNSLEKNYIDEFRALDAAIGDGDLGITIRKGCTAIIETLKTFQTEDTGALIKKCGIQFNQANPSTFGVLTASAFIEGGKKVLGKESLTLDEIAGMFRAALEGIMKRGKAKTGEKTMLDALEPAVEALEKAASEGKSIKEAFEKAAEAAKDGLERTKNMEAKTGRAKAFGSRTVGEQDPGATVVYRFLREVSEELHKS